MIHPKITTVAHVDNRNGESPVWDTARCRLLWVDNVPGDIFAYYPASGVMEKIASGLPVCSLAVNHDGRLVIAGNQGILLWNGVGDAFPIITEHQGEQLSFNDITVCPRGNIYGGTFYWGEGGMERRGKIYVIRTDGTVSVLDEGMILSNGLGFSPDGRTFYFTDTMARKIFAYDVNGKTGVLSNRRTFVTVPREEGLPDGLAVDADGFVWSAHWYASEIVRYAPDGTPQQRIRVPAQQVSSVGFGGTCLGELYITTAGEYWASDEQPTAFDLSHPMGGPLYRVGAEVCGLPPHVSRFEMSS